MNSIKKKHSETFNQGLIRVLIWGATAVTLGIWTTFQDPFNPLKLSIILLFGNNVFITLIVFSNV